MINKNPYICTISTDIRIFYYIKIIFFKFYILFRVFFIKSIEKKE